jgi:hypothetical protein
VRPILGGTGKRGDRLSNVYDATFGLERSIAGSQEGISSALSWTYTVSDTLEVGIARKIIQKEFYGSIQRIEHGNPKSGQFRSKQWDTLDGRENGFI